MVNMTAEEEEDMIRKFHKGFHISTDLTTTYNEQAKVYDQVTSKLQPLWPEHISEELSDRFHNKDLEGKLVMDMAAGTGLTGESLYGHGFRDIHALDMSSGMLCEARTKNIYTSLYTHEITAQPTPFLEDGCYDAVVCGAGIIPNHMNADVLKEFVRITKTSGYVVFTVRDPGFKLMFMEIISGLMRDGKVELLFMELVPYCLEHQNDYEQMNGYLITLRVL